MRTLDLRQQTITVEELLNWAGSDSVLIRAKDGHEFLLEEADDFDREVAMLGNSEKFMKFLEERAAEAKRIALDDVRRDLGM